MNSEDWKNFFYANSILNGTIKGEMKVESNINLCNHIVTIRNGLIEGGDGVFKSAYYGYFGDFSKKISGDDTRNYFYPQNKKQNKIYIIFGEIKVEFVLHRDFNIPAMITFSSKRFYRHGLLYREECYRFGELTRVRTMV